MTEQTETLPEFIDVTEYRHDHGHRAWAWRCSGADVCDGWLSLDHSSEESATRSARKHQEQEHAALQACRASISGRCLAVTQGDPGCATTDGECVHAPAAAPSPLREQIATAIRTSIKAGHIRYDTLADAVLQVPAIRDLLERQEEAEAALELYGLLYRRAETGRRRVERMRDAVHIADDEDVTDWQRGYRSCAQRVLAALNPQEQPTPRVHVGGNAEDCPACDGTNPPYPFICPGNNQPPTA